MPNLLCPKCGGEWYKCVCFSYEKSGYQNINYPIALAWQEKAESLAKENEEFKKNEQYYETVAFRNGKNDERIAELEKQLDEALGQCRICVEKNRIEKLEAQLASLQARVEKDLKKLWLDMCEDCNHMGNYNNDIDRIMTCNYPNNKSKLCVFNNCPLTDEIRKALTGEEGKK